MTLKQSTAMELRNLMEKILYAMKVKEQIELTPKEILAIDRAIKFLE